METINVKTILESEIENLTTKAGEEMARDLPNRAARLYARAEDLRSVNATFGELVEACEEYFETPGLYGSDRIQSILSRLAQP